MQIVSVILRTVAPLFALALASPMTLAGDPATELAKAAPAAAAAVERFFPRASIVEVGKEAESGVHYFEVVVRDGERQLEMEVTADGRVGEIESVVTPEDLPAPVRSALTRVASGATVRHAERHDIHGVPDHGTFAPLSPARVIYEVSYEVGGERRAIALDADGQLVAPQDDDGAQPDDLDDDDAGDAADLDLG